MLKADFDEGAAKYAITRGKGVYGHWPQNFAPDASRLDY